MVTPETRGAPWHSYPVTILNPSKGHMARLYSHDTGLLPTVTAAVRIEMHSCTVQYNSDPFSVTYTCMLGYNTHTVTMGVHCWQRNQISIVVSFVIICTVRLCTHTCTVYRCSFSHIHIHTCAASPPNYHTNST